MLQRVPTGKGQLRNPSDVSVISKMLSSNTHSSVANLYRLVIWWTCIDSKIPRYSRLTASLSRSTNPRAGISHTMSSVYTSTALSIQSGFSLWKCCSTAARFTAMTASRDLVSISPDILISPYSSNVARNLSGPQLAAGLAWPVALGPIVYAFHAVWSVDVFLGVDNAVHRYSAGGESFTAYGVGAHRVGRHEVRHLHCP